MCDDFISNPLGVIQIAFQAADAEAASKGTDWGESQLFTHFLLTSTNKVPLLNSKSVTRLQPNTLVRYRGMVQDMPGHELYTSAYKDGDVWRTNKYTDGPKEVSDGYQTEVHLWTRRLIYCIPVPGQNDWTEPSGSCMNLKTLGDEKHQRDEDEDLSCQAEEFLTYIAIFLLSAGKSFLIYLRLRRNSIRFFNRN